MIQFRGRLLIIPEHPHPNMVFSPVVGCCSPPHPRPTPSVSLEKEKNKQKWETIDLLTLSWHSQHSQVILLLDYKQSRISSSDKATLRPGSNETKQGRSFILSQHRQS